MALSRLKSSGVDPFRRFENIVFPIEWRPLDILEHFPTGHAGQRIFVFRREDNVDLVPFVEDDYTASRATLPKTIPVASCWVDHVSAGSMPGRRGSISDLDAAWAWRH